MTLGRLSSRVIKLRRLHYVSLESRTTVLYVKCLSLQYLHRPTLLVSLLRLSMIGKTIVYDLR